MPDRESISEILASLYRQGYTEDFKTQGTKILVIKKNILLDPEGLIVHEIFRFEGESDLQEEAAIFAVSCPKNNLKGTYLVAFGPMMDADDCLMVQRLHKERPAC